MALFLMTGGTGFVGSHVAEEAIRRGYAVRCLARATADGVREPLNRRATIGINF